MSRRCTCSKYEMWGEGEPIVRHSLTCSERRVDMAAGKPVSRRPDPYRSAQAEVGKPTLPPAVQSWDMATWERALATYRMRDACGIRAYLDPMGQDREVVREKVYDGLPKRPPRPTPVHHPTLRDIADRDEEIMQWHLREKARIQRAWRIEATAALACILSFITFWLVPLGVLVGLTALLFIASLTVSVWAFGQGATRRVNLMRQLQIVPFTAAENTYLIHTQIEEPFQAVCPCPGCGSVAAHLISEPKDAPGWAKVIRHCGTCEREWANG